MLQPIHTSGDRDATTAIMDKSPIDNLPRELRIMIIELMIQDHDVITVQRLRQKTPFETGFEDEKHHELNKEFDSEAFNDKNIEPDSIPISLILNNPSGRALATTCKQMHEEVMSVFNTINNFPIDAQKQLSLGFCSTLKSIFRGLECSNRPVQEVRIEIGNFTRCARGSHPRAVGPLTVLRLITEVLKTCKGYRVSGLLTYAVKIPGRAENLHFLIDSRWTMTEFWKYMREMNRSLNDASNTSKPSVQR